MWGCVADGMIVHTTKEGVFDFGNGHAEDSGTMQYLLVYADEQGCVRYHWRRWDQNVEIWIAEWKIYFCWTKRNQQLSCTYFIIRITIFRRWLMIIIQFIDTMNRSDAGSYCENLLIFFCMVLLREVLLTQTNLLVRV